MNRTKVGFLCGFCLVLIISCTSLPEIELIPVSTADILPPEEVIGVNEIEDVEGVEEVKDVEEVEEVEEVEDVEEMSIVLEDKKESAANPLITEPGEESLPSVVTDLSEPELPETGDENVGEEDDVSKGSIEPVPEQGKPEHDGLVQEESFSEKLIKENPEYEEPAQEEEESLKPVDNSQKESASEVSAIEELPMVETRTSEEEETLDASSPAQTASAGSMPLDGQEEIAEDVFETDAVEAAEFPESINNSEDEVSTILPVLPAKTIAAEAEKDKLSILMIILIAAGILLTVFTLIILYNLKYEKDKTISTIEYSETAENTAVQATLPGPAADDYEIESLCGNTDASEDDQNPIENDEKAVNDEKVVNDEKDFSVDEESVIEYNEIISETPVIEENNQDIIPLGPPIARELPDFAYLYSIQKLSGPRSPYYSDPLFHTAQLVKEMIQSYQRLLKKETGLTENETVDFIVDIFSLTDDFAEAFYKNTKLHSTGIFNVNWMNSRYADFIAESVLPELVLLLLAAVGLFGFVTRTELESIRKIAAALLVPDDLIDQFVHKHSIKIVVHGSVRLTRKSFTLNIQDDDKNAEGWDPRIIVDTEILDDLLTIIERIKSTGFGTYKPRFIPE
jgi:hypothetical protein